MAIVPLFDICLLSDAGLRASLRAHVDGAVEGYELFCDRCMFLYLCASFFVMSQEDFTVFSILNIVFLLHFKEEASLDVRQ